jgi:hypothetical protein
MKDEHLRRAPDRGISGCPLKDHGPRRAAHSSKTEGPRDSSLGPMLSGNPVIECCQDAV